MSESDARRPGLVLRVLAGFALIPYALRGVALVALLAWFGYSYLTGGLP